MYDFEWGARCYSSKYTILKNVCSFSSSTENYSEKNVAVTNDDGLIGGEGSSASRQCNEAKIITTQTKEEGVKLYSAVFLQSIVQRKFKEGDFGKDQRFD